MIYCKHCKKEIGLFHRGGFDFCSDNCILDYIETLESKVHELSRLAQHGNGPVLLGWMDAHKKAMDRVEELEETMKMGLFSTHKMNKLLLKCERWMEEKGLDDEAESILEEIYEETNLLQVEATK